MFNPLISEMWLVPRVGLLVLHRAPPQVADRETPPRHGWYRGNEIPGRTKNCLGEGTPNKKPTMKACGSNMLPQESTNLSADSDRVRAPMVSAGSMDFGGTNHRIPNKGRMKRTWTRGKSLKPDI